MRHESDRLLKVVIALTSFTMITTWLPLVRGVLDGSTYEWGQSFLGVDFGGRGVGGDYWLLLLQAVIGVAIVFLGWRGARQPFHWLLLLWNVPSAANSFYNAFRFPEHYRFRGDTLGVDVSLAWVGPLFWSVLVLLSVAWVARDVRRRSATEPHAWGRANSLLLTLTAGLVPLQFVLLRFGEPHGLTDQIGVVLTMLQWVLLNLSFVGRSSEGAVGTHAYA